MNKKLLSVILSGVLMVISAGVFVSCEDYDDDISNLQTQINDLGSTLTALQSQVQAGKWITSVSSTTGGLTIVFSDGTQYTIENGKDGAPGAPGKDGNGTLVEVKDGYWYLNGEKTDYLALTKEDTTGVVGQANVPYVEDGYWYFYNEEGEAVKSDYKALGATYAVKDANTGVWTLHVPDADGTMQSIDLPTAAAKITGLTFVNSFDKVFYVYKTKWTSPAKWAGPKTLPSNGSYIYGAKNSLKNADYTTEPSGELKNAHPVFVQVSPADVAKDIEKYTLINSKNATLGLAVTAEPYNELISADGKRTKAATNGNGLYDITIAPQAVSAANITALDELLKAANENQIGYALVADNVFRSAYEVKIVFGSSVSEPTLDYLNINNGLVTDKNVEIKDNNEGKGYSITNQIKVGTTYTVTFSDPAAVYDSYFEFSDTDINAFGITYDNESRTFTVGKNPDEASVGQQETFTMTVYTLDINGKVVKTELTFNLSAEMSNNMLAAQTVDVSKDGANFQYNLSDVTVTGTNQWKLNVDLGSGVEYHLYKDKDCTPREEVSSVVGSDLLIEPKVATNAATDNETSDRDKATRVIFTINPKVSGNLDLNKTYYLKTTFKTKDSKVLNTVILPVMFTAPALKDLFVPQSAFVVDGVINAYFYKTDPKDGTDKKSVDLNKYFTKNVPDAETELNTSTNIVSNKKSSDLAKFTSTGSIQFKDAKLLLNPYFKKDKPNAQYELGYGEALIVKVSKDTYVKNQNTWNYQSDSGDNTYSFKIRLMSPIMEGSIKTVGDGISIKSNDLQNGANITDAMIKGYDFANNEYNVVPDKVLTDSEGKYLSKAAWADPQISNVKMNPKDDKLIKKISDAQPATMVDGKQVNGYFKVTAESLSNTTETAAIVTVTDIWNYTKKSEVKVTIVK